MAIKKYDVTGDPTPDDVAGGTNAEADRPASSNVVYDIGVTASAALPKANIPAQSFTNLLSNGDFTVGDPPVGWTTREVTSSREGSIIKIGPYSMKLVCNMTGGTSDCTTYQSLVDPTRYQGRTLTFGAWCRASSGNDKRQLIVIWDNQPSESSSSDVPHDNAWHWMTATHTVWSEAGQITAYTHAKPWSSETDTDDIMYVSGAILVEGSVCPAFSPKPPELDQTAGGANGEYFKAPSSDVLFDALAGKSYIPIAVAAGAVDAITADYTPNITLADMTLCAIVALGANVTTTPTFAPDGLTAHTITKHGGSALVAGDIPAALAVCILEYNLANTRWELLNPKATAYVHPNHSGDVTSVADGAQTLVATAGVNAIALAAAVHSGAIDDGGTQAPTHDAVFDALALKLANVSEDTSPTLGGDLNDGDFLIYGAYHNYTHTSGSPHKAVTLAPGTDGRLLKVDDLNDNLEFTITDPGVCCTFELWLVHEASATEYTPTWVGGSTHIIWVGGTAPACATSGGNVYIVIKRLTENHYIGEWAEWESF